jgi:hypothetical protein
VLPGGGIEKQVDNIDIKTVVNREISKKREVKKCGLNALEMIKEE